MDARNNSLSSYGDDFADDDNGADSDKDNNSPAERQERVERSPDRAAAAVPSTPASEAGAREPTSDNGDYSGSNAKAGGKTRSGDGGPGRRRSSASDKDNENKHNDTDDGRAASTTGNGSGGVTIGLDSGAATTPGPSPSLHELEERLRDADAENSRLREALEKSATRGRTAAGKAGGEDVGKELEILKSQVEAAK